jgi:hypothetical protein
MKLGPTLQLIGLCNALLVILACSDHELPIAPNPKPEPSRPASTMAALGTFTYNLAAEGGSFDTLPSYSAYPEGVKVTVTVSGRINVWSDTRADYYQKTVDAGPGGVWIDGGLQQCDNGVSITFGSTGFGPAPCLMATNPPGLLPYDTSGVSTFTAVVYGNGSATRTPNIPKYAPPSVCDTITCHRYTGSQAITIVPAAGDLDLQAFYSLEARSARKALFIHPFTNTDTYAHQMVYFTDSTTPRGLPIKPLSNTWTMMDPGAPPGYWNHTQVPASCLSSNPPIACSVDIRETGIWAAHARVNGVEHDDAVTLYCAESEPWLNNDLVRQQMLATLDSSNGLSSNQMVRRERQFFILQDTVTPGAIPYLKILPESPGADMCRATPTMPTPQSVPPNTRVVAWGHDHPFEASEDSTQTWGLCHDDAGRLQTGHMQEGASPDDRTTTDIYNDPAANPGAAAAGWLPMPSFIIDYHMVYVLRPGQKLGDELAPGNKFNWDGLYPTLNDPTRTPRRCGWPKRLVP